MNKKNRILVSLLLCVMFVSLFSSAMPVAASVKETSTRVAEHATTIVENPTGKKGIIASYWTDPGTPYYDDPVALGVDHALFNIDVTELVSTNGTGEAFEYNGKIYYYNNYEGKQLYYTFLRMQEIRDKGITLTVQVNMQWSDDPALQELIFPSGREPGHNYYALNTSTEEAREVLAAAFHYLVTKCPYVNNWIVGCEINSPEQCNYCGTLDVGTNVTIAAQTYDLMYQAVKDVNPSAMNYVCLDNIWNFDNGQGIPAKTFLEEFAKLETNKTWHLAYHPYPVPYGPTDDPAEWNMWGEKSGENGYLNHTQYSGFITGANIEVLSDFVKDNYGEEHRIILTEFGFDARAGESNQAAAIYYTYKAAERDDMIDACIYQPWADNGWDFREMGVMDANGNKRQSYDVFKYMDSNPGLANEEFYLNHLEIDEWTDNIIKEPSGNTDNAKAISGVYIPENDGKTIRAGAIIDTVSNDLVYECVVVDYDYAIWGTSQYQVIKTTENKYDNWAEYEPTHSGKYGFVWRAYENGEIVSEAESVCEFTGGTAVKPGFIDVVVGDWYYDAVMYVNNNGIMTGKSAAIFAPNESLARGQFASILYRLSDEPAVEFKPEFSDVEADIWYTAPILWAKSVGIVNGYADGRFGPGDMITREQMAIMMYNYAKSLEYDISASGDLSAFKDASSVSDYAKTAVQWAVGAGIISGKENGTILDPQGETARAQCAVIMQNFMKTYN